MVFQRESVVGANFNDVVGIDRLIDEDNESIFSDYSSSSSEFEIADATNQAVSFLLYYDSFHKKLSNPHIELRKFVTIRDCLARHCKEYETWSSAPDDNVVGSQPNSQPNSQPTDRCGASANASSQAGFGYVSTKIWGKQRPVRDFTEGHEEVDLDFTLEVDGRGVDEAETYELRIVGLDEFHEDYNNLVYGYDGSSPYPPSQPSPIPSSPLKFRDWRVNTSGDDGSDEEVYESFYAIL